MGVLRALQVTPVCSGEGLLKAPVHHWDLWILSAVPQFPFKGGWPRKLQNLRCFHWVGCAHEVVILKGLSGGTDDYPCTLAPIVPVLLGLMPSQTERKAEA